MRIPISGQYCALGIEMAGTKPGHDAVVAPPCEKQLMFRMAKSLEIAISKAAALPEAVQEQLGRELLDRIETLKHLRAEIEIGIRELDSGLGEELDLEALIRQLHAEHAGQA